jgi:transglutaminase-like putative cysteine protease
MLFEVRHITKYSYPEAVSESVGELRMQPIDTETQTVHSTAYTLHPQTPLLQFTDFFGNQVTGFSIPQRHESLSIEVASTVETFPAADPGIAADIPLGEARRPFHGKNLDRYVYRLPTPAVPLIHCETLLPKHFWRDSMPLREALDKLNNWIYEAFTYLPGSTGISTPLHAVIQNRAGVCQDFAHLMLSILRAHGIVARYVSGYIEANNPTGADTHLAGAHASHAWIEVLLRNETWWGFDPTNNQTAGERHVRIAVGRDYQDVAPLRGTYRGPSSQALKVAVTMHRCSAACLS